MNTHVLIVVLLSAFIIGGCKSEIKNSETKAVDSTFPATPILASDSYFSGEYGYNQGKATLKDYATGSSLAIRQGELASQLAQKYSTLKLPAGENAFVQLYGRLSPIDEIEQHPGLNLEITKIISLQPRADTTKYQPLTGDYITYVPNNIKPTERFTFTLHPDYTYTFGIYNLNANSNRTATGTWHLLQKNYIQFTNNSLTNYITEAFFNTNNTELTFKNSKRVYYKQE